MSFSNQSMKAPVSGKPHIAKIEGYWRVSPKKENIYGFRENESRWNKAHLWASNENRKLIKEQFHKGE